MSTFLVVFKLTAEMELVLSAFIHLNMYKEADG